MTVDRFSLKNKTAIITGVTKGLGRAMAIALAESGADIIGIGISDMKDIEKEIQKKGRTLYPIYADLMEIENIEKVVNKINELDVSVDFLINNAGITIVKDFLDTEKEDWDKTININLRAVYFLTKEISKIFIKNNTKGKIINIASVLAFRGGDGVSAYTISKFGVNGLTKALSNELSKYNITVNAIAPGFMKTDNSRGLHEDEELSKKIIDSIPLNRWGNPEDLSGLVVFLCSQASEFITGETIVVDGGYLNN